MDADEVRGLVGRADELVELERALDRVVGSEPWFVQIIGEPGIGKSRLLDELCRRGEARGYLVLDGRAAEFERDIPFGLIVDALNDFLGSLDPATLRTLEDDVVLELASIFPSLPRAVEPGVRRPGEGAERYRLHYAIRSVLERLTRRQAMLLALDDVHWADAASIEVMTHLLRRFRGPLLMAVAYRHAPTRLVAALEGTARGGFGTRLELAPLSPKEAKRLIGAGVDEGTRAMLYRESGGNPFYMEQLARSGHATSVQEAPGPEPLPEAVPRAVIAAIEEELLAVSAPTRLALQAAAVAGDPFEPELIAAISERDVPAVLDSLDVLLRLDFIRPTDVPRRFRFRHPIVRRAVYDAMPYGWRIGAHSRASTALAAAHAHPSARAHHVENSATAGDEAAIALLLQAGRDSAPRAPETAGRWLLAATRLLPAQDRGDRRLSLLVEAASALTYAGAYDRALEALDEASTLLAPERVVDRAELVTKIVFARRMTGRPLESRALVAETLEALPGEIPEALCLRLELALDHYWRGEFTEMSDLAQSVLALARRRDEQLVTSWAAALCSVSSTSLNRPADGLAELREAKAANDALSDGQLAQYIDVTGYVAQAAALLEQTDIALECATRGLRLAQMSGQGPYVSGQLVLQTNALFMKGRITEAMAVAETATDAAVLTGNDQFTVWALWADAMVCSCAGDTTRALASAREAVVRSDSVAMNFFSSLSRLHLASALHAAGDAEAARAELAAFEAGPDQRLLDLRGGHGWELLIRTQLALGDLDAAEEVATAAEARARATALPQRLATALNARGAVLLARGDARGAIAVASEVIPLAETAGNPLLAARARAVIGTALGCSGETKRAIAELERAERTLHMLGARREADAAAFELRRLGRRTPRRRRPVAAGSGIDALSPREREVATLVASGQRNRDVARALFVSEKTVETHLGHIYDKLGLRSRAALAAVMAGEGAGVEAHAAAVTATESD